jgi:hypothetical protein
MHHREFGEPSGLRQAGAGDIPILEEKVKQLLVMTYVGEITGWHKAQA